MNVYTYASDLYCEDCGRAIRKQLIREGHLHEEDDLPQGPYPDGGGEADVPQQCGAGAECKNAIELSGGRKIGAWLENKLTADGIKYVQEAIREGSDVA